MKRVWMVLAAAVWTASALTGCSSSQSVEKKEYSGFLKDYSKLQPEKSVSGTPVMRWISPKLKEGNYSQVYLDAPVLYLGKDQQPNKQVSQATMDQIVAYLGGEQRSLLQRKQALATAPGPNTLRVRSAVTAITAQKEGFKAYEVLPVALVYAAANNAAGGRDSETAIYIEGEITDSQSGEVLAQIVRKDAGPDLENTETQLTLQDMKPAIDKWMEDFYKGIKSHTRIE